MSSLPAAGAWTALAEPEEAQQYGEDLRNFVAERIGASAQVEFTIASGVITPTIASVLVDTESDATADDLDRILQTNLDAGSLIVVSCVSAARVVTLKHGNGSAGQMLLRGDEDLVLDDPEDCIVFERIGTAWVERLRSHRNALRKIVVVASANYTALASDCGKLFTNLGAGATRTVTLDDLPVGWWADFVVEAAQEFRPTADTGETISDAASTSTTAGYIGSNTVGDTIRLIKTAATTWRTIGKIGSDWAVSS